MSRRKQRDLDYDKLVAEYRRIAKQADQRLVRLEKLSSKKGFENVENWAYKKAMRDVKYWAGEPAKRFNTKPPNNMNLLKAKIRDIQEFLGMATSTKKGIVNVYKKRADSINKKYGTDFTWEDVGKYFESAERTKLDKMYGSKTAVKAVGQIQQHENEIVKKLKKGDSVDLKIDDLKVKDAVDKMIADYGLGVVDLY